MGKPESQRKHKKEIEAARERSKMNDEKKRQLKNTRTKARNAERKAENIAKCEAMVKRSPKEQLAHLDQHGYRAVKERKKLAERLDKS